MKGLFPFLIIGAVGYFAYTNGYLAMLGLCPSGTLATTDPTGFLGKSCTQGVAPGSVTLTASVAGLGAYRGLAV